MAKLPRNNNKGYFLIELMVAISILTIGFLGFLTLVSRAISANRVISDYLTANYLAAEGIELIKNKIDSNYLQPLPIWNQDIASDDDYEIDYNDAVLTNVTGFPDSALRNFKLTSEFYEYDGAGNQTPFKRRITISYPGGSAIQMKVKSTVSWIGRGGNVMEIYVEDYFFDWKS